MSIIQVQSLCKKYTIIHHQESYTTLRDVIARKIRTFNFKKQSRNNIEEFWALKDVSFEIRQGDKVGIIGRNGAGKSTLLKLLSRITEPSQGKIILNGRVASLLEVGTGFHPELTGRENIFLNGAILGMTKAEISKRFDEIVIFSEIEKFIDMPVKRYSSGMYMKLAFSVAAHLQTEILIVDEVLAVGDMAFQKKCLSKMSEIGETGKTVLFVSHNMGAIQSLCDYGIVLNKGQMAYKGSIKEAIENYSNMNNTQEDEPIENRKDRRGSQLVKICSVKFIDAHTLNYVNGLVSGMPVLIEFLYKCNNTEDVKDYSISIAFSHPSGGELFVCSNQFIGKRFNSLSTEGKFYCKIDKWPLNTGRYVFRFNSEVNGELSDAVVNAGYIDVEYGDFYGKGAVIFPHLNGVFIEYDWVDKV